MSAIIATCGRVDAGDRLSDCEQCVLPLFAAGQTAAAADTGFSRVHSWLEVFCGNLFKIRLGKAGSDAVLQDHADRSVFHSIPPG